MPLEISNVVTGFNILALMFCLKGVNKIVAFKVDVALCACEITNVFLTSEYFSHLLSLTLKTLMLFVFMLYFSPIVVYQ